MDITTGYIAIVVSIITVIISICNHKKIILNCNGVERSASIDITSTNDKQEKKDHVSSNNIDITTK